MDRAMRIRHLLAVISLLAAVTLPSGSVGLSHPAASLDPGYLAIYHGWPSLVNLSAGNVAAAAAVFGRYDIVVFAQGLEEELHGDHAKTRQLIQLLRDDYATEVYGYLSGADWETSWSTTGMAAASWQAHVDMWQVMGVTGIFIDAFSYDWNVSRTMQNAMLDAVHARNLRAFVNGWFIDHVFSSLPDPNFPAGNPAGLPSKIDHRDLYLLESFVIMEGQYDLCQRPRWDTWITKAAKAQNYRSSFGTAMWAMTTADRLTVGDMLGTTGVEERLNFAWHGAAMFNLDGFGWTEPQFSATGSAQNSLPWRERPAPNAPVGSGSSFTGPVQQSGSLYTRATDLGQFRVVCDDATSTHTADFVPWISPTATPTATATPTSTSTPTATSTATATATTTAVPCSLAPYDFNNDGVIDIVDVSVVASRWMDPAVYDPRFDVAPPGEPDGVIDIADVGAVVVNFGRSCP